MRRLIRGKHWLAIGAGILLGLVFIVSGLGKLPYHGEFLTIVLSKSLLTLPQAIVIARWVPWVELVLGSLLIIGIAAKLMASLSAALIVVFIANNSWMISLGLGNEPCGCFGWFEHLSLLQFSTIEALYLDVGLLVLVSIILLFYPRSLFTIHPWFLVRGKIAEKTDWFGSG